MNQDAATLVVLPLPVELDELPVEIEVEVLAAALPLEVVDGLRLQVGAANAPGNARRRGRKAKENMTG